VPCRQSREMRVKAALALLEAGESEALIFTKAVSAGADELTIAAETADGDLVVEIRGTDVRPTTPMSDRVGALGGQVVRTSGTLRVRIPCGLAQRLVNCSIAHRHHPFVRCALRLRRSCIRSLESDDEPRQGLARQPALPREASGGVVVASRRPALSSTITAHRHLSILACRRAPSELNQARQITSKLPCQSNY
jgi:hypothetical protein